MPSIRNHRKIEKPGVQEAKPRRSKMKILRFRSNANRQNLQTIDKAEVGDSILQLLKLLNS
jgi:hypothetical protein